jgi:hypothetical protein
MRELEDLLMFVEEGGRMVAVPVRKRRRHHHHHHHHQSETGWAIPGPAVPGPRKTTPFEIWRAEQEKSRSRSYDQAFWMALCVGLAILMGLLLIAWLAPLAEDTPPKPRPPIEWPTGAGTH